VAATDNMPRDLEVFCETCTALGIDAGSERVAAFMRLPEPMRDQILDELGPSEAPTQECAFFGIAGTGPFAESEEAP
jgi:hypothetical protein